MQCCFVHLQEACVQGNLIAICLEQLTDPYPPLRQWLAICLGRVWFNYEAARWCAVSDSAPDKLYCLLSDPLPEVRVMIMCFFRVTTKTKVFVCLDSFATILFMEITFISWISMIHISTIYNRFNSVLTRQMAEKVAYKPSAWP